MKSFFDTAGERISIDCRLPWVQHLLSEAADGELRDGTPDEASIALRIEQSSRAFPTAGWHALGRDAWHLRGAVVIANACSSGFDVMVAADGPRLGVRCRWRPPSRERIARHILPGRFHLLARDVLCHYPAMWWAGLRGRSPLHVSAITTGAVSPLIAGPGGVGKSTLVAREVALGGRPSSENVCVGDGTTVWGLVEPMRIDGGRGRRMPHGRRETRLHGRLSAMTPDCVVVLRRGSMEAPIIGEADTDETVRALTASTYMAGELTRFWGYAATLALGTGLGPVHPAVDTVATRFAARLPCVTVSLPSAHNFRLGDVMQRIEALTWI